MRRYDDPVEVRNGLVDGMEGPAQFLWRDRLWQVRAVVSRWVETAPWWEHGTVRGLLGDGNAAAEEPAGDAGQRARESGRAPASVATLLAEQQVWRVDAGRGRLGVLRPDDREVRAVVDLVHDTETGRWRLVGCMD